MSNLDFQAAVNAAKAVVENAENRENGGGKSYTYPLLYPPAGNTVTVRPLFNPASGQILRLVNRHEKVPCYRTYGIECPICKIQQQVKDMTGQDPFGRTKASRSRGIAFAQFISSTTPIDKGGNKGNFMPGDIILFMFPWTVYQQINTTIQAIAQTPTGMDQAFSHASNGMYIQIQVSNDFRYTTTSVPYFTFNTVKPDGTPMNDDEFVDMLGSMESLYDQVIPNQITDEVDKQVREYADAINRQYITPRVASQGVPAGTAPVNYSQGVPTPTPTPQPTYNPVQATPPIPPTGQYTPPVPQYNPQTTGVPTFQGTIPMTPTQTDDTLPWETPSTTPVPGPGPGGKPACFGNHQSGAPQCICCPEELNCSSVK